VTCRPGTASLDAVWGSTTKTKTLLQNVCFPAQQDGGKRIAPAVSKKLCPLLRRKGDYKGEQPGDAVWTLNGYRGSSGPANRPLVSRPTTFSNRR
jgi:hypothetical protein